MTSNTSDGLFFKCPKCLWWIGASKPASPLTKQQLDEATFELKCTPDCGWEGHLAGRDAFPLAGAK
jgi:hypothetical protein